MNAVQILGLPTSCFLTTRPLTPTALRLDARSHWVTNLPSQLLERELPHSPLMVKSSPSAMLSMYLTFGNHYTAFASTSPCPVVEPSATATLGLSSSFLTSSSTLMTPSTTSSHTSPSAANSQSTSPTTLNHDRPQLRRLMLHTAPLHHLIRLTSCQIRISWPPQASLSLSPYSAYSILILHHYLPFVQRIHQLPANHAHCLIH
jgi:hypothetical protein